jgi:peptide/nickel transport system permease protein
MEAAAIDIQEQPRKSELRRIYRIFFSRWLVKIGLALVLLTVIMAIFAPWLAPYDPNKVNYSQTLQQPSRAHLLGTDPVGRDTLSRVIYGSRVSMMVALGAVGFATLVGLMLGMTAGFYTGAINVLIMRFTDSIMTFPPILFALVIAGLLGGGLTNIVLAIGIGHMPNFTRLMCGQVLSVKENDYIVAARSIGCRDFRIMFGHILPNSFPPLIVQITLWLGSAILAEAGLSFLGVGIKPPTASWGSMINEGFKYLLTNPILSFAPGTACMLSVFGFNMVGDGLRDALDPRLRGKI